MVFHKSKCPPETHTRAFTIISELENTELVADLLSNLNLYPQQHGYKKIDIKDFHKFEKMYAKNNS